MRAHPTWQRSMPTTREVHTKQWSIDPVPETRSPNNYIIIAHPCISFSLLLFLQETPWSIDLTTRAMQYFLYAWNRRRSEQRTQRTIIDLNTPPSTDLLTDLKKTRQPLTQTFNGRINLVSLLRPHLPLPKHPNTCKNQTFWQTKGWKGKQYLKKKNIYIYR